MTPARRNEARPMDVTSQSEPGSGTGSTPKETESWWSVGVIRWTLLLSLLLLGVLAVTCLMRIVRDFNCPLELTYPNSVMIYHARDVQHGRPIYSDWRKPPHVLALYGPLSYLVPGLLGRWLAADEWGLYRIGRGLALLYTTGTLVILALLLHRQKVPSLLMLLCLLLFITSEVAWPTCMLPRPDAAELMLVLLGLALFVTLEHTPWRYIALAAFVTAFLFKQSAFIGPLAIGLYLLLNRRVKHLVLWGVLTLIGYGGAFFVVNQLTSGLYHLNNFAALRANVTWANLHSVVGQWVLAPCAILPALALAAILRRFQARQFDLFSLYFILSFGIGAAATIRDGSAANYFLKPLAVATLIVGPELTRWLRGPTERRETGVLALSAVIVLLLPKVGKALVEWPDLAQEVVMRDSYHRIQYETCRALADELNALNGPILCQYDPVNLWCRNPLLLDTLTFAGLADQGAFDDRHIVEMIRRRELAAIVLQFPADRRPVPRYQSTDSFRTKWADALLEAGYRGRQVGAFFIYQP